MFELTQKNLNQSLAVAGAMLWMLLTMGYVAGDLFFPGHSLEGMGLAFLAFCFLSFIAYYEGSTLLLRAAGGKIIQKKHAPELFNVVEEMSIAAGLSPIPQVYIIKSDIPNAFATGRSPETAAIAVTEGLFEACTRDQLQGVIAHEIAHIKHRDILYMTVLSVMMASIGHIGSIFRPRVYRDNWTGRRRIAGGAPIHMAASRLQAAMKAGSAGALIMVVGILLLFVGPLLAKILYFAGSRTREFLADASAAIYTRNPSSLADALEEISKRMGTLHRKSLPGIPKALLIVGPALFQTHPLLEERTAILRKLAGEHPLSYRGYAEAYSDITGKSPSFFPPQALEGYTVGTIPSPQPTQSKKRQVHQKKVDDIIEENMPWIPGYRLRRPSDTKLMEDPTKVANCRCGAKVQIPSHVSSILDLQCPSCQQPVYSG